MKKLFIMLSVLFLSHLHTQACGFCAEWEGGTNFLIVKPYANDDKAFPQAMKEETIDFWHNYVQKKVAREIVADYFNEAEFSTFEEAKKENAFLKLLHNDVFALKYLSACLQLQGASEEQWDYERKETLLTGADKTLATLGAAPAAFKYRVALLRMRLLKCQGEYEKMVELWNTVGQHCPDPVMLKRLQGYYASTLFAQERYLDALNIYASIGDPRSINMCISHYAGVDGVRELAEKHTDGDQTLYYAMQDYANFYWSAVGSYQKYAYDNDDESEETESYTAKAKVDGQRMKALCRQHLNDADKLMWYNLLAWLELCDGNHHEALQLATKAVEMKGATEVIENAQRIQALARVWSAHMLKNDKDLKQIAKDFLLIRSYVEREAKQPFHYNQDNYYSVYHSEEYMHQYVNFCFMADTYMPALQSYFQRMGTVQARLCSMMLAEKSAVGIGSLAEDMDEDYYLNLPWNTGWFSYIDSEVSVEDLADFMKALSKGKANDAFAKEVIRLCDNPEAALNDLMGTKLMRNGKYSQALPYLQALTPEYVGKTNYQPYLATRKYQPGSPFIRTQRKDPMEWEDGEEPQPILDRTNYKLIFCQQMIDDLLRLPSMNGNEKVQLELQVAGRMFQASQYGDLWAMTEFSWSSYIPEGKAESLMCNQARNMLKKAKEECTDSRTLLMVYYGLAVVPAGNKPFYTLNYNWDTEDMEYHFELFHPAREAYDYLRLHSSESELTRTCDVLKWYSQRNGF